MRFPNWTDKLDTDSIRDLIKAQKYTNQKGFPHFY